MTSDPFYFSKHYELLNSSEKYFPSYIKNSVCRYCGKSDSEVSFKQVTHLIPELLGKNNIHTFDECDKCNMRFSNYESNLAVFFRPYTTLIGIEGKHGVPMFQSRTVDSDEKTRTKLIRSEKNKIQLCMDEKHDFIINEHDKTMEVTFRKPPFVPLKVYKALVKIGLSLLPIKYDTFNKESFEWLLGDTNELGYINRMFTTTLKRKYFNKPNAELYRTKLLNNSATEWPEYTLIVFFANQVVQIFLPFSKELMGIHSERRTLEVNLFTDHLHYAGAGSVDIHYWDISLDYSVKHDHKMLFSYENVRFNTGNIDIDKAIF